MEEKKFIFTFISLFTKNGISFLPKDRCKEYKKLKNHEYIGAMAIIRKKKKKRKKKKDI